MVTWGLCFPLKRLGLPHNDVSSRPVDGAHLVDDGPRRLVRALRRGGSATHGDAAAVVLPIFSIPSPVLP